MPQRLPSWFLCALTAWGSLVGGDAWAHPFDEGLAGHRLKLTVGPDSVQAEYLVEEPVPWVLRDLRAFLAGVEDPDERDQARYTARRLEEFEGGLQLYVDGERVSWERRPWTGNNGVGNRNFVVYGLSLWAPLDARNHDTAMHLLDINHADVRVARLVEVWGGAEVDLRGCSLWTARDGQPATDHSGDWTLGGRNAELRLTRRVNGPLMTAWSHLGARARGEELPLRVGPAGIPGPVDGWGVGAGVGAMGVGLLSLLFLRLRRRPKTSEAA